MKTMVRKRTGPAKARARRLAFFFATILGMVSPKMMTLTVTMTVAIQVSSSPKAVMAMTEPREEMAMFTKLLPMRMAERASSNWSMMRTARAASLEPSSAWFSRRMRLAEEKAISDPEKKAERARQITAPMR